MNDKFEQYPLQTDQIQAAKQRGYYKFKREWYEILKDEKSSVIADVCISIGALLFEGEYVKPASDRAARLINAFAKDIRKDAVNWTNGRKNHSDRAQAEAPSVQPVQPVQPEPQKTTPDRVPAEIIQAINLCDDDHHLDMVYSRYSGWHNSQEFRELIAEFNLTVQQHYQV